MINIPSHINIIYTNKIKGLDIIWFSPFIQEFIKFLKLFTITQYLQYETALMAEEAIKNFTE